jgi:hypothetical protein
LSRPCYFSRIPADPDAFAWHFPDYSHPVMAGHLFLGAPWVCIYLRYPLFCLIMCPLQGVLTLQRHLLVSHLISMGYEISCQAF